MKCTYKVRICDQNNEIFRTEHRSTELSVHMMYITLTIPKCKEEIQLF